MKKVIAARGDYVVYFHPLRIVYNVFMRNGTYSLMFIGRAYNKTQGWYIWQLSNKKNHKGLNVWQSTEWSWTVHLVPMEVSSYKHPGNNFKMWNTRRKLKSNWRVSTNLGHKYQSNCSFCGYTWTIFQRTVEIWVKSKVSTYIKAFALWKSTTKAGRM